MIDIVKLANGNVAIYDNSTSDFISMLSPDIVEIECNANGNVKVIQDNGNVQYFEPSMVANTQVLPAAAIPFTGTCADLGLLLSTDFFFVVSGGADAGSLILLDAQETETTGTFNVSLIKSFVVPANTFSLIMVESEVGFRSNANLASNCIFQLLYDAVIVRDARIEFDATGPGDQHAAGYTLKFSGAYASGGTVSIRTFTVGGVNGTWTVESFRVYGVI